MTGATHQWGMPAPSLYESHRPSWLAPHLVELTGFCPDNDGRVAVLDTAPVTRIDGQDLIVSLRPKADLVVLLVVTNNQQILQDVIVAGFEPFSRVSTPDGDRFMFFAETRPARHRWPELEPTKVLLAA